MGEFEKLYFFGKSFCSVVESFLGGDLAFSYGEFENRFKVDLPNERQNS